MAECAEVDLVEDLVGSQARAVRKQRHEAREALRLQRLQQAAAARRNADMAKKESEEARLQRVAQKAAARRAAKEGRGKKKENDVGQAVADGSPQPLSREDSEVVQSAVCNTQADTSTCPDEGTNAGTRNPVSYQKQADIEEPGSEALDLNNEANKSASGEKEVTGGKGDEEEKAERKEKKNKEEKKREKQIRKREKKERKKEKKRLKKERKREKKRRKKEEANSSSSEDGSSSGSSKVAPNSDSEDSSKKTDKKKVKCGSTEKAQKRKKASSSSSSSSSSCAEAEPAPPSPGAMAIAKALATGAPIPRPNGPKKAGSFAWERPMPVAPCYPKASAIPPEVLMGSLAATSEVERFLNDNQVDGEAAVRFRTLAPQLQRIIMDRGPIVGTRNPSSVLIARVRDVEMGRTGNTDMIAPTTNPEIEKIIFQYSLDEKAAQLLRSLPPEHQRLVFEIPLHEARNPSAFLMAQLSQPRLLGCGESTRMPCQPRDPTTAMLTGCLF